jgi:hypothetical protein
VLADLVGHERNSSLDGERGEQARLAPRARAEVEPALVPGRLALDVGSGQSEHEQLRALVLHGGAPVADGRDGTWIPLGQGGPDRAEP